MKKIIVILVLFFASTPYSQAALRLKSDGKNPNFIYEYDPKALATSISFIVRSGNTSDPKGKEGLIHFSLESLLRGTKQKSRADLMKAVERLGGNLDANAGYTYSTISLNVISENLPQAIRLLAETILQPALRAEEIEPLRQELLAKLNVERSNNRMQLRRAYRLALYSGTNLAFPPDGTIDGIKNSSIDDIRATLHTHLQANNILVAVTSNQEKSKVKNWLEDAFRDLPEDLIPPRPTHTLKKITGRTLYLVPKNGSSTVELQMGHYGIPANSPIWDNAEAGLFVFGSNFNSRLIRILRKENGWTYGAASAFSATTMGAGNESVFLIYSFPQKEHAAKAAAKTVELYEQYVKDGITKEELAFAQNSMANSYPFQFANAKARLDAKLSHELDGTHNLPVSVYQKKIRSLTPKKIESILAKVHDPKNMVIVAVGDEAQLKEIAKAIPGLKEVKTILDPMSDKEFR